MSLMFSMKLGKNQQIKTLILGYSEKLKFVKKQLSSLKGTQPRTSEFLFFAFCESLTSKFVFVFKNLGVNR